MLAPAGCRNKSG